MAQEPVWEPRCICKWAKLQHATHQIGSPCPEPESPELVECAVRALGRQIQCHGKAALADCGLDLLQLRMMLEFPGTPLDAWRSLSLRGEAPEPWS